MTETTMRIESIQVVGRHRKDLGDITGLAKSIARDTLINPITVTPGGRLIAGERRLAAARSLGWQVIGVRIVDTLDDAATELRLERDENRERKDMTPSEMVSLGRALEALEGPKALERRQAAGRKAAAKRLGRRFSPEEENPPVDTEATVAKALGVSQAQYYRAKTVISAAHDPARTEEDRAVARQAVADMDSGATTIGGAYERVKKSTPVRAAAIQATSIASAAMQRRSITSAEAALSGICHGLKQVAILHPDITSEEAAQWVGSLSESRRVIASLINILKERTNAQQS